MLFRKPRPEPPAPTPAPPAAPKYGPAATDLEAIADFIDLRLALIMPPSFPRPDDTGRAILALSDATMAARVIGKSLIQQGSNAILEWTILRNIASHWHEHPDYRSEWDSIA